MKSAYAAAGVPQYWPIDQDAAQSVTVHRLEGDHYAARATMPLAWVLSTRLEEHDLG